MSTATTATPDLSATWHEALSLGAHVRACDAARGRSFAMRCAGERLHALLGPRFFTTVCVAAGLLALLAGCV
jgi:hypothetical protein